MWATDYYTVPLHILYRCRLYGRGGDGSYNTSANIWQYHTDVTGTERINRISNMGLWPKIETSVSGSAKNQTSRLVAMTSVQANRLGCVVVFTLLQRLSLLSFCLLCLLGVFSLLLARELMSLTLRLSLGVCAPLHTPIFAACWARGW